VGAVEEKTFMELQQQVCSLELAKRLQELGVKQESLFWWIQQVQEHLERNGKLTLVPTESWVVNDRPGSAGYYSAFTVAELGEILPESINVSGDHFHLRITHGTRAVNHWAIGYTNYDASWWPGLIDDKKEANGRAKLLIYLLENNLLKVESASQEVPQSGTD
jgi:hypothetical protein